MAPSPFGPWSAPAGAGLAELLHRHALIASAIFGRQGVTPAAVDTLMGEGLSAAVPECATERRPSSRPGGCASRSREMGDEKPVSRAWDSRARGGDVRAW